MDADLEFARLQEYEGLGWGKSFPVQSVQEFVRIDSQSIPERYIQEKKDRPVISEICHTLPQVPVIDFTLLLGDNEDERAKLDLACKEWGFFQIVNHGVSDEVLHNMKAAKAAFFELPLEEKKKYAMAANDIQGYGQGYVVSDEQKLDWGDLLFILTRPCGYRNLAYWPVELPGFRKAVEEYSMAIQEVADELLANLSLLMKLEKDCLKNLHGEMKQGMRMNYYPPCSRPDLVLGVSPHSDASSITLLLQDDETTGLEVRHKKTWVPVKPIPSGIVINIGDVVEAWSNGVYKSIEHRAITNGKKSRMSIATFVMPADEVEIGPFESMVDDISHPRMYKNLNVDFVLSIVVTHNVFRNKLQSEFRWWDQIDQFVLLGAVPFPKDVTRLKELGVGGVITLNEPYETLVPSSLYHDFGIDHLVIPTRDYAFPPSFIDISRAVEFIHSELDFTASDKEAMFYQILLRFMSGNSSRCPLLKIDEENTKAIRIIELVLNSKRITSTSIVVLILKPIGLPGQNVHQAVIGMHGLEVQFTGINFLESFLPEFSPSTSSAMGLLREFHEQCRMSLELDYLKVLPFLDAIVDLQSNSVAKFGLAKSFLSFNGSIDNFERPEDEIENISSNEVGDNRSKVCSFIPVSWFLKCWFVSLHLEDQVYQSFYCWDWDAASSSTNKIIESTAPVPMVKVCNDALRLMLQILN
ncbi:hypothetical protein ACFE04_001121 [Oxalis oulophora]